MKKLITLSLLLLITASVFSQSETGFSYKKKGMRTEASYTPDGKYLAISKGKKISFCRFSSDYIDKSIRNKQKIKVSEVSPETKKAALYSKNIFSNQLSVYNLQSTERINSFKINKGEILDMSFVNDSTIAFIDSQKRLKVMDLSTGKYLVDTLLSNKPLRAIAACPDEGIIAAGGADKIVYILNLSNGSIQKLSGPQNWIRTIDIFTDGKRVAVGSDDNKVYYYNLEDPAKNLSYSVHRDWIRQVKFTQDGNYIASVGDDKVCTFYDLKNKSVTFKIKSLRFNPTISIHPTGKEFLLNSQNVFNVKVRDLSTLNIIPYIKLKDKTDKIPPQIYISQPNRIVDGKAIVFNHLVPLEGTAMDESGLRDIKVNGKVVKMKENGNFMVNIPLSLGDNPVTVEAIDINDNVAVKKFTIVRKNDAGVEVSEESVRNFLLVIGINEYTSWPKLANAVRDAQSVKNVLFDSYGFDSLHTTVLLDSMATKANIEKALRNLIPQISSADNLLIYYAGHGHFDPVLNEGYWVPVDAKDESQYLSNTTLLKYLSNINSRHTFLVVDACFSGSLFASRSRGYVDNVEKYRSRWGLTSGRLETVADGAYGENSPFATNFVQFLKENQKDEFPVSEVVQHVKVQVANTTKQTPIGSALRDVGDEGGEFVFRKKKK